MRLTGYRVQGARPGVTLMETLLVAGLFAVGLALLLPAVQIARVTGWRTTSMNNMRQIINGAMESAGPGQAGHIPNGRGLADTLARVASHSEGINRSEITYRTDDGERKFVMSRIWSSPADPSWEYYPLFDTTHQTERGNSSYGINAAAFPVREVPGAKHRGVSQTVLLAEHYARCGPIRSDRPSDFNFLLEGSGVKGSQRRSTFADAAFAQDQVPPQAGQTPPATTFQASPHPTDCDSRCPQTPHRQGMLMGYFDGSVRPMATGVAPRVFWSAVSPWIDDNADR